MKVIICGGRNYQLTEEDYDALDGARWELPITEVVSGAAKGADQCGEWWAKRRGIKITRFPADWKKNGLYAGLARNIDMAKYADAVIAFPGGKGTAHMVDVANSHKLEVWDWRNVRGRFI